MTRLLKALEDVVETAESTDGDAASRAASLLGRTVGADGAYLVYADDQFHRMGEGPAPLIKQKGYWIVNRSLVSRPGLCAFDVADGKVTRVADARPGLARSHVAALLPMAEGASEMLVIHGLSKRFTRTCLALVRTAAPILAHAVMRKVDAEQRERQRNQINALADISQVLTRTQTKEETLTDLCTTIAGAAGFDSVSLAVFDDTGERFAYRALNLYRFSDHPVADAYRSGAFDDPLIEIGKQREPLFVPDLTVPQPNVDDGLRMLLAGQALFSSQALIPLQFRDELLGVLVLSSFTPHAFDADEVRLLQSLAAQAVTIIKGLEMYEEVRRSRDKLQEYSSRLRESMGIEYRLARTDPLTGLPNRRFLEEAVASEFQRRATNEWLCLVMVDVDRFKRVNDRYGHVMGDDVLKSVGSVAWRMRTGRELVGRYGGDEFLFVLPGRPAESGLEFGEMFRDRVSQSPVIAASGEPVTVSVSVGVADAPPGCDCDSEDVIRRADQAMYRAKAEGGNRVGAAAPATRRHPVAS